MATVLTDLALRLYAQTSELKKGLKEAGSSATNFKKTASKTGKDASKSFSNMSKGATSSLSQMTGGLGALGPAASGATGGLQSLAVGARALNAALGPIGIIVAVIAIAVKALMSYFNGTVEGAAKLAKIMGILEGVMSFLKDAFIKLGETMVWAFENPKEAIAQLWEFIKQNLINRFQGMVEFFTSAFQVLANGFKGLGKAIKGIFNDDAKKEAEAYFQAMGEEMKNVGKAAVKMSTGFEVSAIVDKATSAMTKLNEQASEGGRIGAARKKLEWDILNFALEESKVRRNMASLLLKTRDYEITANQVRMDAIDELVKMEKGLQDGKVKNAEETLRLAEAELANSVTDEESKKKVIAAQIALNEVYKVSDDKMRELVNRQNEMRSSTQKYVDAGIVGWENLSRVQAEAAYKTWQEVQAVDKKAIADRLAQEKAASDSWANYQIAQNETTLKGRLDNLKAELDEGKILLAEYEAERTRLNKEADAAIKDSNQSTFDDMIAASSNGIDGLISGWKGFSTAINDETVKTGAAMKDLISNTANQIGEVANSLLDSMSGMLQASENKELKAAGDNAKEREKIERKYAKKEQRNAILSALINGALGITKAFAQLGPVGGAIGAALIGLSTAAQVSVIKSQSFADGGIAYGPTMGLVGEYPGARSNPEVIAPLDKLQNMLNPIGGQVVFRIDYDQLVGVLENGTQIKAAY